MHHSFVVALALLSCSAGLVRCQHNYWRQCLNIYSTYFPPASSNLTVDIVVHFRCPEGYILDGDELSYCVGKSSHVPANFPTCRPIQLPTCPKPQCNDTELEIPNANILDRRQMHYEPGTVIHYQCLDNVRFCMNGTSARTCLPDGTWSEAPRCNEPLCPIDVTRPRNDSGVHIQTETGLKNANGTHYLHGARVQYCCDHDAENLTGHSFIECQCDGEWSHLPPPHCDVPQTTTEAVKITLPYPVETTTPRRKRTTTTIEPEEEEEEEEEEPEYEPEPIPQPSCRSWNCPWWPCPTVPCQAPPPPPPPQPIVTPCAPSPCLQQPCSPLPCCAAQQPSCVAQPPAQCCRVECRPCGASENPYQQQSIGWPNQWWNQGFFQLG